MGGLPRPTCSLEVLIGRGAAIEAADNLFGMTALLAAASQNQTEALRVLLENGAKINARAKDRRTALMLAALLGHSDSLKLLLDRGAEVNAGDTAQSTALSLAKTHDKKDIVGTLEEAVGI